MILLNGGSVWCFLVWIWIFLSTTFMATGNKKMKTKKTNNSHWKRIFIITTFNIFAFAIFILFILSCCYLLLLLYLLLIAIFCSWPKSNNIAYCLGLCNTHHTPVCVCLLLQMLTSNQNKREQKMFHRIKLNCRQILRAM